MTRKCHTIAFLLAALFILAAAPAGANAAAPLTVKSAKAKALHVERTGCTSTAHCWAYSVVNSPYCVRKAPNVIDCAGALWDQDGQRCDETMRVTRTGARSLRSVSCVQRVKLNSVTADDARADSPFADAFANAF